MPGKWTTGNLFICSKCILYISIDAVWYAGKMEVNKPETTIPYPAVFPLSSIRTPVAA